MNIKIFGRNIAAVSIIEIMMIFTIIGVVTTACIGLSRPKYEYMKKIKLYAALDFLETSARQIQNEGVLDYTTDINTCTSRVSNNVCYYTGKFPNLSNQLPKVLHRSDSDPGRDKTIYNSLNDTEKIQFQIMQSGLCDRFVRILDYNAKVSCSSFFSGVFYSANVGQNINASPNLVLPNGQVVYFWKSPSNSGLLTDTVGTVGTNLVAVDPSDTGYDTAKNVEKASALPTTSDYNDINNMLKAPHETRVAVVDKYMKNNYQSVMMMPTAAAFKKAWGKNTDFFEVLVDINCKKINDNDKVCGPDKVGEDIFPFRLYRDGTVVPDYRMGFPKNMLTARILKQDPDDHSGKYKVIPAYSIIPLTSAKCYANLMGNYNGSINDFSNEFCKNYANVGNPIGECIGDNADSVCKVIINKPSFVLK